MSKKIISFLPFQEVAFWFDGRELWLVFRRQAGKSYLFACKALSLQMKLAGEKVFIINASLLMGRENIMKEAEVFATVLEAYAQILAEAGMGMTQHEVQYTADGKDQRERLVKETLIDSQLDTATLATLFEANALETRVWHSNTSYSRSRVVAANPATARGYTGHKFIDEAGFVSEYDALEDAIEAISSRNPRFITWRATTPPMDSTHPVFAEICPPADAVFKPNPRGNWYKTADDIPVLRVDARDAELAGLPMYARADGKVISIEEARKQARNKSHFDRNYLLKFLSGGNAAVPRHLLQHAQMIQPGCGTALDLGEIGNLREEAA